ncbi:Transcriptional regulator, contains XRE-family HTH domain [Caldanaerobius fijiensis DSM 17918]|uniref:Transcriptional regulator, contains XRE-family HTH domain n=1 Tax=Caldanaerobius fijiensis DSM 17918 TaxID=1121256 RepID=A0A1M5EMF8_9THEO|nr:helix-turn-helix transcriptional regulator [Caldanaerobius fijiensis]SHF80334.1 Transcriptional regulator, contains XRE-family HTH domain [Caldanaerobius fijiensis DSM 17918]
MENLGKYLKGLRKNLKLTTRKVQELSGVSDSYISQIENGVRKPSADTLRKLAPVYKVNVEELLKMAGYLPQDEPQYDDDNKPIDISFLLQRDGVLFDGEPLTDEDKDDLIRIARIILSKRKRK